MSDLVGSPEDWFSRIVAYFLEYNGMSLRIGQSLLWTD